MQKPKFIKRGWWFAVLEFVTAVEVLGFYTEEAEAGNKVYSFRWLEGSSDSSKAMVEVGSMEFRGSGRPVE